VREPKKSTCAILVLLSIDVTTACDLILGPVSDAAWTFLRLGAGSIFRAEICGTCAAGRSVLCWILSEIRQFKSVIMDAQEGTALARRASKKSKSRRSKVDASIWSPGRCA